MANPKQRPLKERVLELKRAEQEAREQLKAERPPPELIIRRAVDVEDEPLVTLFGGRLVRGTFQLMVGPGEAGKGMVSVDTIARFSTGAPFPGESLSRAPTRVMICVTEDSAPRVKGRLRAAEADLDNIFFVDGPPMLRGGLIVPSPVAFDEDAGALAARAKQLDIGVLFLETMLEHLGTRDGKQPSTNNEAEVRRAIAPVTAVCRSHGLIGWGVMHPRKSMEGGIEDSISGSAGFRNIARSTLHVYQDPTDESEERWRLFISEKANYLRRPPQTMRFKIVPSVDPSEGRVEWAPDGRLYDRRNAEAVWIQMRERKSQKSRRDYSVIEAEKFLASVLSGGRVKATDLERMATEAGISWSSIERAKQRMRVESVKEGFQGSFSWKMPEGEM